MEKRIRKGGLQTPQGFLFELSGGNVALDLGNTLLNRPTDDVAELIPEALDFLSWARQAELLTRKQEGELRKEAKRKPQAVEAVRRRAVQLRECLFQLFSSIADGKDTAPDVMAEWNQYVKESLDHYETVRAGEGLAWTLRSELYGIDTVLWVIIHSAIELLTGPQAARIRRCASDTCDWLFVDTSKRGNRRWCDMTVCGNRAKARRFYQRKKSLQPSK
jgi:predicted RNA-binding Zn ribbon-like protein